MLKSNRHSLKKAFSYEILLLPAFVIYFIFFVYPILSSFFYGFTDWNSYRAEINFVGLDNFKEVLKDKGILIGIKNSVKYAIIMTIVQNALAIIFAVALDKKLRTKNLLRTIIFAPAVLSPLVVGFLWSYIMSPSDFGLLNMILSTFGIEHVNWLGDPKLALYSVILTQVWQWVGWAMVIYIANLQSMPEELYEAASLDGANGVQRFINITAPMLFPSFTINSVMAMIGGLKVYDIVYSLTGGGPGHATDTIVVVLLARAFNEGRYGYASAFAVVFFLIVLIITLILLKFLKKWEDSVV